MTTKGETIRLGQLEIVFFATKDDTDGHADVFELRVPPGAKVPGPHHHTAMDEVLLGLEGTLTYVVGDRIIDVAAGERAFSPRGVLHHFVNRTNAPARALVIGTPATLGPAYFREIAAIVARSAGGPPNMTELAETMRRYGLEPAPLAPNVQTALAG